MQAIHVHLGERSYDISVGSEVCADFGSFAKQRCRGQSVFLVTDKNVIPHARSAVTTLEACGLRVVTVVLPPGEGQKCLDAVRGLYDQLVEMKADRRTLVMAVGGGVIGDLAGFVAATYARGLALLMVPTTLLAMVDSSVGGKVGINHPRAKNLIGAFHQPVGVWIDTAFLNTLPEREYRSGLAEVVKYGVSLDADLFVYLEEHAEATLQREPEVLRHLVARSCQLKAQIVERDEREETGLRALLNYGHTFGHAFETVGGYGAWLHGEAVAAGMMCASRLAERRGLISPHVTRRQGQLLSRLGLPTAPLSWPAEELMAVMRHDKKAVEGRLRFVLPQRLGAAALCDDIPEEEVRRVLNETLPSKFG
jgi:3-dehydroquinate synthase